MTCAIFTLLYDVSYLPGALLVGALLKDMIKSEIKLGILIDKAQFQPSHLQVLNSIFDEIIDTTVVESKLTDILTQKINRPELVKTFTKINLWTLTHYDKIVYLDADTLPNPDSNLLDLFKLDFPEGKILASPDSGFPDIFNSGMFLMKPNEVDYKNLVELVNSSEEVSFDGADQGLFNQYFNPDPDWVGQLAAGSDVSNISMMSLNSNWIKLPFLYNVTPNSQYEYLPAYNYFSSEQMFPYGSKTTPKGKGEVTKANEEAGNYGYTAAKHFQNQVKLVHFIGPYKPWNYPFTPNHLEWWGLWYKYYNKELLDSIKKPAFSTPDSLWDPSKSSPPHKSALVTKKPVAKPKLSKKPSYLMRATEKSLQNKEKESIYGYHPFQRPERSFQLSEDYVPTHPVIGKRQQPEGFAQELNVDKVTEELEKLNPR